MRTCEYIEGTFTGNNFCGARARYLVCAPGGEYRPYCRAHMTRVLVTICDVEYSGHEAGHRNAALVLPVDAR